MNIIKIKVYFFISLIVSVVSCVQDLRAVNFFYNNIQYSLDPSDNTVEVVRYFNPPNQSGSSRPSTIEISETVEYNGVEYPVVSIGEKAFYEQKDFKLIKLPETIERIGAQAFYKCSGLRSFEMPTSLISVGEKSFYWCSDIKKVNFSASIRSISKDAFDGCTGLESITVSEDNPVYSSSDGILYNKEKTEFLIVPEGIIGPVKLPEWMTEIPARTFSGCSSLQEVKLPEGLTSIGDWAFANSGLTSVVIPESLKFLGEDVFYSSLLERVEILAPLNTIPYGTFLSCKNLKEVVLPNTVKVLERYSFQSCESLPSIFIPASVETITAVTFNGSYSLTEFIVDEDNPWFTSEGQLLLSKDRSLLVDWPSAEGDVVLPDYISETAHGLFEYQQRIRSLTFPASIKKIGGGICDHNHVLRSVYCYAVEPPEFGGGFWDIYEGRSLDITVYVPASSLELYRNNSRWNRYKLAPMKEENGVEALPEEGESNESDSYTVFSMDGRLLLKEAPSDSLQSLSPGIYIVNGRKVAL